MRDRSRAWKKAGHTVGNNRVMTLSTSCRKESGVVNMQKLLNATKRHVTAVGHVERLSPGMSALSHAAGTVLNHR
jgi:hypothetical protein